MICESFSGSRKPQWLSHKTSDDLDILILRRYLSLRKTGDAVQKLAIPDGKGPAETLACVLIYLRQAFVGASRRPFCAVLMEH